MLNASRALALSNFLRSKQIFEDKLQELKKVLDANIEDLTNKSIPSNKLDELNEKILERKALVRVSLLIQELEEELEDSRQEQLSKSRQ